MNSTAQSMSIGQVISYTTGRITISLQRTEHTYTVTTTQGGTLRIDDNSGAYTTEAEARAVARLYAEAYRAETAATIAAAQTELRRTIDEGGDCTDLHAKLDALHRQVLDDIVRTAAANGGTLTTGINVTVPEIRLLVARRLAAMTRLWNDNGGGLIVGAELSFKGWEHAEAIKTIADTVPVGTHRQVGPTMAGAQLADTSDPQQRAINTAAANGGTIVRGGGPGEAPINVLRPLVRKGLATYDYLPGARKVVLSVTLTKRGFAAVKAVA